METTQVEKNISKMKLDFKESNYATGRRKESVARVWIKKGTGKIFVNGKTMNDYFKRPVHQLIVVMPLQETNAMNKFDVKCNVKGGGLSGQAGAIRLGISRALIVANPENRSALKSNGLLTRDSRKVERKKPGQPGARKKFQFSKR